MLKKRLMPLILFNDWKMVKTINFSDIRNYGSPVVAAKVYNAQKVDEIAYLDIRASLEGREPDYNAVQDIIRQCFMPVTIGGGISSVSHVRKLLQLGADKVSLCTAALKNPDILAEASSRFGKSCIVVAMDVKKINGEYEVFSHSGTQNSGMSAVDWARKAESLGAGELFVNSIDHDGKMDGYDLDLMSQVTESVNIPVIAGGGAGHPSHMVDLFNSCGISAVAAGSLFLYTEYSPIATRKYLKEHGVDVRPY